MLRGFEEIQSELQVNPFPQTGDPTHIIQRYIDKPLLIHKRKFDIRCFALVTSVNGVLQAYFYADGYLRTASREYDTAKLADKFIHLTNDAVQKKSKEYGKYENGNKLSFGDFQRFLNKHSPGISMQGDLLPKLKAMVKDTILATWRGLDKNWRAHSFEVLAM